MGKRSWISALSDEKCAEFVKNKHKHAKNIKVMRLANFDEVIVTFNVADNSGKIHINDYGVGNTINPYENVSFYSLMREEMQDVTVDGLTYEQAYVNEYKRRMVEERNYAVEFIADKYEGSQRAELIEDCLEQFKVNIKALVDFISATNSKVDIEELLADLKEEEPNC